MNESQQALQSAAYDGEIDLRELSRILWAGKWLIAGITLASLVIAATVALMLPNIYRSEALLAPNQNQGAGGLSSLAAEYGGLAGLAGINLRTATSDKTALGLEILRSRKFISDFIQRHDILVPLMAANGWNGKSRELEIDSDVYDIVAKKWVRKVRAPRSAIPSRQESYEVFNEEILSVAQDRKTGFVTIAVDHYSPEIAKKWVDWLAQDINTTIMRQEVEEAEQAIEYLNKQISATSLAELQSVFFGLIEEKTKIVMLAKESPEYIFRTIDPAVEPELPSRPKRGIITTLGMFLGGLVGILSVLLRNGVSRKQT